jgi:two-component system, NtrC family, sensor histidine kinase HydH
MYVLNAPEDIHSRYALIMESDRVRLVQGSRQKAASIALLLLLLACFSLIIPASDVSVHNILHHLNFLPLMIAGMLFGWRGAVMASAFGAIVNAPLIAQHWTLWPIDAKDQIVELTIFSAAGLIAGYLSDRERAHRQNLEQTRQTLENVYIELSENVARMKQTERLSAAGQLAASLAHEIRNPLASISGAAGILRRGAAPPEYLEDSLEIIQKESQRLNKLLTGFLNFAKPRSPRLQLTDPNAILVSVASLASHTAEASRISLVRTPAVECPEIECDPEQLKQVLLNLVINAIEASPSGSEIQLRTLVENKKISIEVEDSGSGIPDEIAVQIFDPFFTTKPKGTGLGLAISSMIVAQHNGSLSFHKNPHGGTTFRLELSAGQETRYGQ